MLYLDGTSYYWRGVTVLPDHDYKNNNQWYYQPVYPEFARNPDTGGPSLSLQKYRDDAGGGGFLTFDVDLAVAPSILDEIRTRMEAELGLPNPPVLLPMPVIGGWVRLILLDTATATPAGGGPAAPPGTGSAGSPGGPVGAGGTIVTTGASDGFVARILQAAKPSLYGDERAAFSVQLSERGVTLTEQALHGDLTPIGVVYQLDYVALRKAYQVTLSVQWDRVQKYFEESYGIDAVLVSTQIDKAISDLREQRVIDLEATNFIPEGEDDTAEADFQKAEAEVREMITDAFFTPTLEPHKETKDDWDKAVDVAGAISRLAVTGGASSLATFTMKQVDWTRIDQKSLNVTMSERTAVRRSIYPQGHLSGIAAEISANPAPYIPPPIDLTDPFFQKRRITAIARADFADDQIDAVHVRLQYGDSPQDTELTSGQPQQSLEWNSVLDNGAFRWPVSYNYDVTFASADTSRRPMQLSTDALAAAPDSPRDRTTESTYLDIVPREDLYTIAAIPIWVVPTLPFDRWPNISLSVWYDDAANGLHQREVFSVDSTWNSRHADTPWKMFILDRSHTTFTYQLVFYGADNRAVTMPPVTANQAQIRIADPWPDRRSVQFVPVVDWSTTSLVFCDVSYTDPNDHAANTSASMQFDQAHAGPQTFTAELHDPGRRQVEYQVTFIDKNGTSATIPASYTLAPRILLRHDMLGHRVVAIQAGPGDFAALDIVGIDVVLSYSDQQAQISVADKVTLTSPADQAFFEFDYAKESNISYSYTLGYRYGSGFHRTTTSTTTTSDQLVVPLV
jgi:hypothetical protein